MGAAAWRCVRIELAEPDMSTSAPMATAERLGARTFACDGADVLACASVWLEHCRSKCAHC
jgi:hypothetical protein